jgi:hypothetical protein
MSSGSDHNIGESPSSTTDFEYIKAMLEATISENCLIFISYHAEKKLTVEKDGKKRWKKKREQSVFVDTYRKITPRSFSEETRELGLKAMATYSFKNGEKYGPFLYKITRIEDYD